VGSFEEFAAVADRHLTAPVARRWKELLLPALDLRPAAAGDTVVGRFGGEALLPDDLPWPAWEGHGPLTLVAAFDCAILPRTDLALPEAGLLQFFYFDGQVDGGEALVNGGLPETRDGSRVVFLPEGTAAAPRPHPEGIRAYEPTELAATLVYSAPDEGSPVLAAAFGDDADAVAELSDEDFIEAVAPWDKPVHQLGGYPSEVQGPPEEEIVNGLHPELEPETPPHREAAAARRLLLQVGDVEETGMLWGDSGQLYWMARPADIEAGDFAKTAFTWQSG
jgi:uncharacterized protein YwqG